MSKNSFPKKKTCFIKSVTISEQIFYKLCKKILNFFLPRFLLGFYGKTCILDLGISCYKTPLEKLNNLGQNPNVAVVTLLYNSSNELLSHF